MNIFSNNQVVACIQHEAKADQVDIAFEKLGKMDGKNRSGFMKKGKTRMTLSTTLE